MRSLAALSKKRTGAGAPQARCVKGAVMAVSRKAMTEGLSKWASSDPLSLVLAWDARDSMNYGMIATGNHQYSNSLRGAPPLVSKGSLCALPVVLGKIGGL